MDHQNLCSKCRKPKTSTSPGSITQWLSVCRCDIVGEDEVPESTVELCATCNKPLSEGRSGTITQFIFRPERCSCDNPFPVKREPVDNAGVLSSEHQIDSNGTVRLDEEAEELALSADHFPVERYKPLSIIGEGSSGTIYLSLDRMLRKRVAVKVLRQISAEGVIAFQEEAKATSTLSHPNIVKILDFGIVRDTTPYMVLELISGTNLQEYIYENGSMSWKAAVKVFVQLCEALDYAHKEGVFHRDIKPTNIILKGEDGTVSGVHLIDFGIAKMTDDSKQTTVYQGHTIVGTPNYMSPDQARGLEYTSGSEIYSLGCVMYECLSGQPPFAGDSALELIRMHASEEPAPVNSVAAEDVPPELGEIISKCLSKSPDDRYQDMADLRDGLGRISEPQTELSSHSEETGRRSSGKVLISWTAALLLLGALLCYVNSLYNGMEENGTSSRKSKKKLVKSDQGLSLLDRAPSLARNGTLLQCQYGPVDRTTLSKLDLSRVESVALYYCEIDDLRAFTILGSIPKLDRVGFGGCTGLSTKAIQAFVSATLAKPPEKRVLRSFNGDNTDFDAADIPLLLRLPALQRINLDNVPVVDDQLKVLRGSGLTALCLRNSKITDRGLETLSSMSGLRFLAVTPGKPLTKSAIESFKQRLPQCSVTLNYANIRD